MEPAGKCQINYGLLPMKGYYFFFNAGTGAIVPFLATYFGQLGLSSILVGYVLSLSPMAAMVAKIIFGGISDRYMKLRFLFLFFQVISTIALLGIHFIPEVPRERHMELHCNVVSNFKYCKPKLGEDDSVLPSEIDIVKCQFECDMDSLEWREHVCNYWNITQVCSASEHPEAKISLSQLPFSGEISINHTDVEKDCAYFRATHVLTGEKQERVPFCNSSDIMKSNCSVRCDSDALTQFLDKSQARVATTSQFIWFLLLTVIAWSAMEVDGSLGDTICFGILGPKANRYGEQRVWGAIGWGASTLATGALIDQFSGPGGKNYSVAFCVMLVNISLSLVISYQIKYVQTKVSKSIWFDVRKVIFDCRVVMFLSCCIVMGMCTGLLWSFLFWHLEVLGQQAGLNRQMKLLQGLTAGVQCLLGELPLFFFSGKIIKRLGHVHSITLVLIAMAVRLSLYAMLTNPWWVLPIEVLQGLTFGLFYATIVSYGSMIAPPGTEATMQALVGAAFGGIGVALGSMTSGWLYMAVGGSATFAIYGAGCVVCCIAHLGTHLMGKRHHYSAGTDSDGSKQSASYASPIDAVFITENSDVI